MLVLILPSLLLLILAAIGVSAYLIFKPEALATVEERSKARQRQRKARSLRQGPYR